MSFECLATEVKRRGNQHCCYCSCAGSKRRARTRPPWTRCPNRSRREKEAPVHSRFFRFSQFWQGGKSLYPPCAETKPMSFEYLAVGVKRRGNQHSHWSACAGCSDRARTRPPQHHCSNRRREKEAPICPQRNSFSVFLLAFVTQGPSKVVHGILKGFLRNLRRTLGTIPFFCVRLRRLSGLPLGFYPAAHHFPDFN